MTHLQAIDVPKRVSSDDREPPIFDVFNGLNKRDQSYIVYMSLWDNNDTYQFDYSQIDGAVEPRVVEMVSTKTNDSIHVVLSSEELAYIQARKKGTGYTELMERLGFKGCGYGHWRPDFSR